MLCPMNKSLEILSITREYGKHSMSLAIEDVYGQDSIEPIAAHCRG